jgi:DASS family divalent anion:Na+ symporter
MGVPAAKLGAVVKRAVPFALTLGIWFTPVPAGLTEPAWHLFAIFTGAIVSVIVDAFPLLTAATLAVAAAVLTGTIMPAKAFAGFANASVLLVIVAFLVARAVVKSGLGRRISLAVVSAFGGSTLGLAYSIFLTDAAIAPAFPSNTARGGVLFPIVLSLAQGAGSMPDDPKTRPLGAYLMFCGMASLAVSSALWLTATSANPIGVEIAEHFGLKIDFGSWLVASSVPTLAAILLLPPVLYRLLPPGVRATPGATAAAREALRSLGPLGRDEKIVSVAFALMVTGWIMARTLSLDLTAVAFAGLGALLATSVLTLDDIAQEGGTLATYLWLAVLFALSGQLNELGFMGYVGGRLASGLQGVPWLAAHVALIVLYVLMHYLFVSQSSQVLALFGVFVEVGTRTGVPAPLLAFSLLFASSYFSTITPQGGSQNVIFVGSGYLTQGELYRVGGLTTGVCLLIFLLLGTPWLLLVAR